MFAGVQERWPGFGEFEAAARISTACSSNIEVILIGYLYISQAPALHYSRFWIHRTVEREITL
jgi:hypothetical protein